MSGISKDRKIYIQQPDKSWIEIDSWYRKLLDLEKRVTKLESTKTE